MHDTQVPDKCEFNVNTKVLYKDVASAALRDQGWTSTWMTEAKELRPGLYTSRTLVPERPTEVPVRLINVTNEAIHLKAGSVVSELRPVQEVSEKEGSGDAELERVIEEMVSRVDAEVPMATKTELISLMREYGTVFSKNEQDMGLTDIVMHRIDTGDANPTRQQLRRQSKPAMEAIDELIPEMLKAKLI